MVLDVEDTHLTCIQSILKQHLPSTAKVWAFGSRVKGTARKYSDLDLAIQLPQAKLSFPQLAAICSDFDESDLPYKVDVIDFSQVDDRFRQLIQSDCIPLSFL